VRASEETGHAPRLWEQLRNNGAVAIPGSGSVSRLTSLVGPHWAKWLAMGNQAIDAETARSIGLVHAICPAESFHADVAAFARQLAALPPEALGLTKLTIGMAAAQDREKARNAERLANSQLLTGRLEQIMDEFAGRRGRSRGSDE
jgi:enoyl-CoA hydratase